MVIKIINDVGNWWKWSEMRLMAFAKACIAAWLVLPRDWQDLILTKVGPNWLLGGVLLVLAAAIGGRLTLLNPSPDDPEAP